ncbi:MULTISPECIES: hypothetical protein [Nostocales]|uniref:Uncharacterized protein n=3 Tax=Nostocales TaxID=1161 RepID=A0A0C1QTU8_9CYAN|nr:hypothetical protein [Tolypothrix bouteillei]KAF3885470.1 hypothetical protein DA73_0400008370 [Tolypothrix bouteillei VB521301]
MRRVVAVLKNLRPLKVLTAFVASAILFLTQACDSAVATTPNQSREIPHQIVGEQSARPNSNVYVPKGENQLSPYEGGMNNFSDVDPRNQSANVKARAEYLKENAERNVIDESSNVGEVGRRILGKKNENAKDFGDTLREGGERTADKAQKTTSDFIKGTQRGIENIKENTGNAASDLGRNTRNKAAEAGNAIRDAVD